MEGSKLVALDSQTHDTGKMKFFTNVPETRRRRSRLQGAELLQ